MSIANTSLYQAAVKLDPTPNPTSSFLSNTSNQTLVHPMGRGSQGPGLGGNAQGNGLTSTHTPPTNSLPFYIRSPSLRCELDCIVAVEHCWNCEFHSSYCRHDPAKYSYQVGL